MGAQSFLEIAIEYNRAGLNVIPFWRREEGGVSFPKWEKWESAMQSESDVVGLFSRGCDGVALICTPDIEVIDIDVKVERAIYGTSESGLLFANMMKNIQAISDHIPKMCVQRTKSGGLHIIYRANNREGNQKLAKPAHGKEAVIETRGKGGLLFVHPTPGYAVARGSLLNIGLIPDDCRDSIVRLGREFQWVFETWGKQPVNDKYKQNEPIADQPRTQSNESAVADNPDTPWNAFCAKNDVLQMAIDSGWKVCGGVNGPIIRLTKPDSRSGGVHATIVNSKSGERLFYPFTTATNFEAGKCYDAFAFYAVDNFGGDRRKAAKELYKQGYGARITATNTPATNTLKTGNILNEKKDEGLDSAILEAQQEIDDYSRAISTKFDSGSVAKRADVLFYISTSGTKRPFAGRGQIVAVSGQKHAGKSFVVGAIAASIWRPTIFFHGSISGGKIALFDTEQPIEFFQRDMLRFQKIGRIPSTPANFNAFMLREIETPSQRLDIVKRYVQESSDLEVLILDNVADLMQNFNSIEESQKIIRWLMMLASEKNILIICVLHQNPGTTKMRGHLGTMLGDKADHVLIATSCEGDYEVLVEKCRYGPIQTITYTRDEFGMPIWADGYQPGEGEYGLPPQMPEEPAPAPAPYPYYSQSAPPVKRGHDEDVPF